MDDVLDQDQEDEKCHTASASIDFIDHEKYFKINKDLLVNSSAADNVAPTDTVRKQLDDAIVEGRQNFFKNRIRQHKLIAKFNMYRKQGAKLELKEVDDKIYVIASTIRK